MTPPAEHATEFYFRIVADPGAAPEWRDEAARQLVHRITPMVRGILHGFGLMEHASDALADLCLKIVDRSLGYDPAKGGRFRDYVAECVRNWARTYFRTLARHDADIGSGDSEVQRRLLEEPDRASEEFSSILSEAIDNEMRERFRQADRLARAELDEAHREMVRLIYDEEMKPREAATQLGQPPHVVHQVTYHHRRRVRELFLELGGAPSWTPRT